MTKSRAVIGYPGGQDGAISFPLGTPRRFLREKSPQKPYNKYFIDQVFPGQDGWILASFFFCKFMDLELGHYPAILTSHLVNNPY